MLQTVFSRDQLCSPAKIDFLVNDNTEEHRFKCEQKSETTVRGKNQAENALESRAGKFTHSRKWTFSLMIALNNINFKQIRRKIYLGV